MKNRQSPSPHGCRGSQVWALTVPPRRTANSLKALPRLPTSSSQVPTDPRNAAQSAGAAHCASAAKHNTRRTRRCDRARDDDCPHGNDYRPRPHRRMHCRRVQYGRHRRCRRAAPPALMPTPASTKYSTSWRNIGSAGCPSSKSPACRHNQRIRYRRHLPERAIATLVKAVCAAQAVTSH